MTIQELQKSKEFKHVLKKLVVASEKAKEKMRRMGITLK